VQKRRKRGDLIEAFKITGKEITDSSKFFTVASNDHGQRGHKCKSYSSHVVKAASVNSFKNRLDDYTTDIMDN